MEMEQNIYLLGFMGSGKSYIGARLAKALNFEWLDLDQLIIDRNQMGIAQIFSNYGENYFRKEERAALHTTAGMEKYVISLGGGTPCFFDNMEWINRHGLSVFIDPSIAILVHRLLPGRDKRPLIKNKSAEELESFIQYKLEERRSFYEQAQVHFRQESLEEDGTQLLLNLLRKNLDG